MQSLSRSSRYLASSSSSTCVPLYSQRRHLSSSSSRRNIGPESPNYIQVPEALQVPQAPLKPAKGILPVPRDVLDKRREYKATPQWLAQATPERATEIDLARVPPHLREETQYKQRMAEMRRTNLREGITELYDRVVETGEHSDRTKERKLLRDLKALHAPARHDEVWTSHNISIAARQALGQKGSAWKPTQDEQARRKADVTKHENARKDERLQSLHSLYLHAKDFIISEEQLDQEIDKVFGDEEVPMYWAGNHQSVWGVGKPKGTSDMIGSSMQNTGDDNLTPKEETNRQIMERLMKITGRLTGGKIPIPKDLKPKKTGPLY